MKYQNMSNAQIIADIAENIEKKRLSKAFTTDDLSSRGGFNSQTYNNFINKNTNIKIETLIDIFRGLGELDKLEKAFEHRELFSPSQSKVKLPKKIRKKKLNPNVAPIWGDE